ADGAVCLEAMLLLPAHHSRLGLSAVTTVNASADLALDLADRRTVGLPVPRVDGVALVLGVVEVPLGQRERCALRRRRLLGLAAVDHGPGLVADHAVRGETVGLLPLLRLGDRARTPVTVDILDADGLLGTLDRLTLGVELDQRGLAGDLLVGLRPTGRAADLDVARLDATEHLGEVPSGLLAAGLGASPGELDVDVVGVRGNAVVSTPAGMRVAGAPDLAVPDHTLDAELLGERNE